MEQTQKQNLDELMKSILKDIDEDQKKELLDYAESLKTKNNHQLEAEINTIDFTVRAILIIRYINELFHGTYDKDYTEIEKLLKELPLDNNFFYDRDLLEQFNRSVYLFTLFEVSNNRKDLLNNVVIKDIVSNLAYNKIISLNTNEDCYIPYDLYMAIKEISKNKSADMFINENLLRALYYYELNITHVAKMNIKDIEDEYVTTISNINANRKKINEIKIKRNILMKKMKRTVILSFMLPAIYFGIAAMADRENLKYAFRPRIETYNEDEKLLSRHITNEVPKGSFKYIYEYKKTDNNKLIVREYDVTEQNLENKDLDDIDLLTMRVNKTVEYDLTNPSDLEKINNNPYFDYNENESYYRTLVKTTDGKLSFKEIAIVMFLFLSLAFASFGNQVDSKEHQELLDLTQEYKENKNLSNESLEKLSAIFNRMKNQLSINQPGKDTSDYDEHNFRI